jgi:phosphatidylglycerol:prolipoprotein diacylglycerol transferase
MVIKMYNVQFPDLGIKVKINPVAFSIGGFAIKWYGVIIAVGFVLAFIYAIKSCKRFNVDDDKFIDCVIGGIVGGIVGARLYYVIFYTGSEFADNPASIFNIRQGGLGIYGGLIGGLILGAIIAKWRKLSVPAVFDIASLGFLIGQAVGRWGNFVNQEAFGRQTDLPWRMVSENTDMVAQGGVHPCFLYESLWCLIGFVLLHFFSRKLRHYDGQTFLLYMLWYGAGRFWIEGLRTDSLMTPYLTLRVSQVVAAASVIVSVILLIVFRKRTVLTGCGAPYIMDLNAIAVEIPQKPEKKIEAPEDDGGPSTLFADGAGNEKQLVQNFDAADGKSGGLDGAVNNDGDPENADGGVSENK